MATTASIIEGDWPGGFAVVKRSIVDFFTNIVPYLVGLLAFVPILLAVGAFFVGRHNGTSNSASLVLTILLGVVGVVAVFYVAICQTSGTPLYGLARADGRKMTTKELYQARWGLFWRLVVATFLIALPIGIGFILLVIPGLVLLVWLLPTLSLVPFVIVEENLGPIDGIKKAYAMGKGQQGRALAIGLWWFLVGLILLIPFLTIALIVFSRQWHNITSSHSTNYNSHGSGNNFSGNFSGGGATPFTTISYAYLYRWLQKQAGKAPAQV